MADFRIVMVPKYIEVTCPHCEAEVRYNYRDINVPEYWGDQWPDVDCPYCYQSIPLDEYDVA